MLLGGVHDQGDDFSLRELSKIMSIPWNIFLWEQFFPFDQGIFHDQGMNFLLCHVTPGKTCCINNLNPSWEEHFTFFYVTMERSSSSLSETTQLSRRTCEESRFQWRDVVSGVG